MLYNAASVVMMFGRHLRFYKFFRYLNACMILATFGLLGFLGGTYIEVRRDLPDPENLEAYRPRIATQIFSTEIYPDKTEKHTLLGRVFKEDREPEELRNIPQSLQNATIAIEDRPFRQHRGIDPKGILRAVFVNLRRGSLSQGGSTITQQLARNMWLTREKTIPRKLKEMLLAAELERRFSKDEILEMYLNEVFYGHGAYGVKRASQLYFNTSPKYLTLAQCALLAGLPQSPIAFSPYNYPKRAKARRHQVLLAMLQEEYITAEEFKQADAEQLQPKLAPLKERGVTTFRAPYFTHEVVRQIRDQYGVEALYGGGLQVYTTLDIRAQEAAEKALTEGVERLRGDRDIRGDLVGQGALAAVEVNTGNVLAMVGGVGPYHKVQYNRADPGISPWGRQPGSSFKPYIWATALEYGYGPDSTFSGDPISIPIGDGKYYTPKNYTPRQGGTYTLRNALAQSVNLVSVRVVKKLGVDVVRRQAAIMLAIPEDRIRPFYSLALGANELSPLEQAVGYAAFANGGLRPTRNFIRRITTWSGEETYGAQPRLERVIRPDTAVDMLKMLRNVVTNGTGQRADISGYTVCGKTGTTNSGRDVWWVGFSPDISAAVWVGNDDNSPMPQGSGGGFCAPIWARFMKNALDAMDLHGEYPEGSGVRSNRQRDDDDPPTDRSERRRASGGRTITVCAETGRLATPNCPETVERRLSSGESSPGPCRVHGSREHSAAKASHERSAGSDSGGRLYTVCAKTGLAAGPSCAQTIESSTRPRGTCRSCGRRESRSERKAESSKNDNPPKSDEG